MCLEVWAMAARYATASLAETKLLGVIALESGESDYDLSFCCCLYARCVAACPFQFQQKHISQMAQVCLCA